MEWAACSGACTGDGPDIRLRIGAMWQTAGRVAHAIGPRIDPVACRLGKLENGQPGAHHDGGVDVTLGHALGSKAPSAN